MPLSGITKQCPTSLYLPAQTSIAFLVSCFHIRFEDLTQLFFVVYYTQNQMAFGLEMAKDICALG